MDRFTRTADIIKAYYSYKQTADSATFVKKVCSFFDFIKDESLSDADLNLLLFLANEAGIPQYYDLLKSKFTNAEIGDESINSLTMSALFHDASLIRGDSKLHRYQKHVLDSFVATQRNRYVLTAPTSFGKTFLVYEIIQKMQYQNVLLIFPAISLLSENYARLCSWEAFSDYAIHSLSEEEFDITQKNIFIFTPERFLSFMDSHQHLHFNFAFIDEVYKIDNSFVIDQETSGENERDTAYRLALEFICNLTDNMLLAGPYMALPTAETELHKSFNDFARDNGFVFLRYNQFEIVSKEYTTVKSRQQLICLFSTTTITEGVNTSAKNIIITSGKKGTKNLRQFDAKNIAGRAGRFQQHYSGRVIDLNNGFEDIVNREPELLEHKNYDINAPKTDVDYQITKDQYLSGADLLEKESISLRVEASGIPTNVFISFRVVGPKDKLLLYERIESMPWWTIEEIKRVSTKLARTNARSLHWSGFQTILNLIFPVVREEKLKQLISFRVGDQQQYSLVTVLLSSYLEGGFMSMVDYYTTRRNPPKTKDEAIRTVADFVYNVFKYHLVKYLGLFDVFFRYRVSVLENVDMDSVPGLGLLMQKLEYNALSPTARKVSDYGVPFKLIDCYDSQAEYDKEQFDAYEKRVDEQVSRLFQ